MADWYVSSAAYNAIPVFAASTAYTVGQIIRPTAPPANRLWPLRCTTAGTTAATEPFWNLGNNATTTSGTAVFTLVGGQAAYGWSAAAGDTGSVTNASVSSYAAQGDRILIASDHTDTPPSVSWLTSITGSWAGAYLSLISVNRAGSVPATPSDVMPGATAVVAGTGYIDNNTGPTFIQGMTLAFGSLNFNNGGYKPYYLRDSEISLTLSAGRISGNNPAKVIFNNTKVRFAFTNSYIGGGSYSFELTWVNTPAAILGVIPLALFQGSGQGVTLITCRGVDFSAVTTTLLGFSTGGANVLLDSCRIAPGVARFSGVTIAAPNDLIELVNCFDGTNIINERHNAAGSLTTERTITLTGGAQDDVGVYSHKMVSSTRSDRQVFPLDGFWLDLGYQQVGAARSAKVEIISSVLLNNDDIWLLLEYQGTLGSSVASFLTTLPATLAANAALAASTATWNSSPATPVKQTLVVTFTPQVAGRVRGLVRRATTVYVNPVVSIG
jgi:hypothetical protein